MAQVNDYYVYVYSHPDTRQPFYVGKGRGRRVLHHMDFEEAETAKEEIIKKIRAQGRKPIIEILQWNLSKDAALVAQSTLIEFIGLEHVTNRQKGRGVDKLHVDFLEFIREKKPLRTSPRKGEEMLILCANKFYRPGMTRFELYDAIRGNLKVSSDRVDQCRCALVVYRGRVLDVYKDLYFVESGHEARNFITDEEGGYDLVANFPSDKFRNFYVGSAINVRYGYGRFAYKKIRLPSGRSK